MGAKSDPEFQTAAKSTILNVDIYKLIDKKKLDKLVLQVGFGRGVGANLARPPWDPRILIPSKLNKILFI